VSTGSTFRFVDTSRNESSLFTFRCLFWWFELERLRQVVLIELVRYVTLRNACRKRECIFNRWATDRCVLLWGWNNCPERSSMIARALKMTSAGTIDGRPTIFPPPPEDGPDGLSQRTSANQIATPLKSFRANLIPRGRPSTISGGLRRCPSLAKSTKSPVRASLRVCHWNFAVALCNLRNKFDNEPTRKNLNWTFDEPVSSLPFRRRSDESKESEHLRNRKESSSTRWISRGNENKKVRLVGKGEEPVFDTRRRGFPSGGKTRRCGCEIILGMARTTKERRRKCSLPRFFFVFGQFSKSSILACDRYGSFRKYSRQRVISRKKTSGVGVSKTF
jgi:hypothetical protein